MRLFFFAVIAAITFTSCSDNANNQVKTDIEDFKSTNPPTEKASELGGCLIGLVTLGFYLVLTFGIGFFIGLVLTILGIPIPN